MSCDANLLLVLSISIPPVRVPLLCFPLCESIHLPPFGIDVSGPTRLEDSILFIQFGLTGLVQLALHFSLLLLLGGEVEFALEDSADGFGGDSETFGEDGGGVASGIGLLEESDEGDGFAGESLRRGPTVGEFILQRMSLEEPLGWVERWRFGTRRGRGAGVGERDAGVVARGEGALFGENLLEHAFWTGEGGEGLVGRLPEAFEWVATGGET